MTAFTEGFSAGASAWQAGLNGAEARKESKLRQTEQFQKNRIGEEEWDAYQKYKANRERAKDTPVSYSLAQPATGATGLRLPNWATAASESPPADSGAGSGASTALGSWTPGAGFKSYFSAGVD